MRKALSFLLIALSLISINTIIIVSAPTPVIAALAAGTVVGAHQNTNPHTISVNVGSGSDRFLLVFVGLYFGSITSVQYNSVNMTLLAEHFVHPIYTSVYGLINPSSGTNNLVVDFGATTETFVAAIPFSGADQTTPTGTIIEADGSGNTISNNASSATGDIVVDSIFTGGAGGSWDVSPDAGQTMVVDYTGVIDNGSARNFAVSTKNGAATTTMSWSGVDVGGWVHMLVPVKSSGGGGGGAAIVKHRVIFQ